MYTFINLITISLYLTKTNNMENLEDLVNDRSMILLTKMERNLNLQSGRDRLIDALSFFETAYGEFDDQFLLCAESLKEIACLLTNPAFSKKLDSYNREHVGPNLLMMINFFERLSYNSEIENAYTHYKLRMGHSPTLHQITYLEKAYAKEFLKSTK